MSLTIQSVTAESDPELLQAAQGLLYEYALYLEQLLGPQPFSQARIAEAGQLPGPFAPPFGGLLVACLHHEPVGCVAWQDIQLPFASPLPACELKRLWVRPAARGTRLGSQLMLKALDAAASQGHRAVYLDTVPAKMQTAYAMYVNFGFQPCPRYHQLQIRVAGEPNEAPDPLVFLTVALPRAKS